MKPKFPTKFVLIGICLVILGVLTTPLTAHAEELTVNLTKMVTEHSVRPIVDVLDQASPYDNVTINIDSLGGDVSAGFKVIRAIHNTQAHLVTAKILDVAASMAAGITMECDRVIISKDAVLIFHLGSIGNTTLRGDMVNSSDEGIASYTKWIISYMHHYDDRVLTTRDWKVIMKGRAVEIYGDQFYYRTGSYYKEGLHHAVPEYSYPNMQAPDLIFNR